MWFGPLATKGRRTEKVLVPKTQQRAPRQSSEHSRFAFNVASTLGLSLVAIIVGNWFTPYLIHNLGVAIFGIIALAGSVIKYVYNNKRIHSVLGYLNSFEFETQWQARQLTLEGVH
jgi:FtsH-binding integral membrane protein